MKRSYTLGRRAEAAEETRRRIVAATFALHAERGIAATTMKDIAARAGVSVGTVYHHFATYDEAIGACGAFARESVPWPDESIFDGVTDPAARIARLARAVFGFYERLPVYERVRVERGDYAVIAEFVAAETRHRRALVAKALGRARPNEARVATVAALLDVGVWRALADEGLGPDAAAARVAAVIAAWLASEAGR
jgi:AcrR family transcriptional regulator